MKRIAAAIVTILVAQAGFAQTDTTQKETPDTVKVGNFVIIKKNKDGDSSSNYERSYSRNGINITLGSRNNTRHHNSNVSTNWFIFDLGFANYRDETNYSSTDAKSFLKTNVGDPAFTENDFKLKNGKSSNVNIWLFMQKMNVTKHVVNLKYGLGMEMYNYRFDNKITYNKDPNYIYRDTRTFSKNKLYAAYATVPFMLNIDATPNKKRGFSFSGGVSAGYLIGSRNKQITKEDGKEKIKGDIGLEQFRFAYIAELGLGPVRLYGSYSVNPLHESGLKQYPYAFGLRFSNW